MASVVVMEDDPDEGEMLAEIIRNAEHEVHLFGNGGDALEFIESNGVDLLITDIFVRRNTRLVPDGGVKLISAIRQLRRIPPNVLPIIAVSGGMALPGGGGPLQIARDVGADVLFEKPIPIDELLLTIKELLAMRMV